MNRVKAAAPWITRRLRVGLAWLWENRRQRRGALIQHHGINSGVGKWALDICPAGADDMPVVVLEASCYTSRSERLLLGVRECLTTEEVATFTGLVERAAWKVGRALVTKTWGGAGHFALSLQLSRRCGKGPAQLGETMRQGCPTRGHRLLCSWDGCTWFERGYAKARLPKGWR